MDDSTMLEAMSDGIWPRSTAERLDDLERFALQTRRILTYVCYVVLKPHVAPDEAEWWQDRVAEAETALQEIRDWRRELA